MTDVWRVVGNIHSRDGRWRGSKQVPAFLVEGEDTEEAAQRAYDVVTTVISERPAASLTLVNTGTGSVAFREFDHHMHRWLGEHDQHCRCGQRKINGRVL